jgi:hypothetical protein
MVTSKDGSESAVGLQRPTIQPGPSGEVVIEHLYPDALALLRERGPHALAVLHVLLARVSEDRDGSLWTRASVRDIAAQLECLSKDAVHRALRSLLRAGVIEPCVTSASTYVIRLDGCGIAVRIPDPEF